MPRASRWPPLNSSSRGCCVHHGHQLDPRNDDRIRGLVVSPPICPTADHRDAHIMASPATNHESTKTKLTNKHENDQTS